MVQPHRESMNQQKQQRMNRALVIQLLRQQGVCFRADLAKQSGLKAATITNIINDFIQCGLVVEDGLLDGGKGRRAIGLRINGSQYRVIGAVLTRTHYSLIIVGLCGEVYDTKTFPVEKDLSAQEMLAQITGEVKKMIDAARPAEVLSICVTMPGPYRTDAEGRLVFITNLPGWDGIPLTSTLQKEFDIPVLVENDANAGVCAQVWFGENDSPPDNMVYILAGQGIGCGIYLDGVLCKGTAGLAGEIGHTTICYTGPLCECGNLGCLEKYCSSLVLLSNLAQCQQRGEKTSLPHPFTLDDVAEALAQGDEVTCREYRQVCRFLAIGLVNCINQLDPGTVIIGDSLAELAPEMMLETVEEQLRLLVRPLIQEGLSLHISKLPYNPTLLEAGAMAAEMIFQDPLSYVLPKEKMDFVL